MGFHRKYLFKCDWCGKELFVDVNDKRSIDHHAFDHGYVLINIARTNEHDELIENEYYACPDCITKIIGGVNDGET